MSGDEAGTGLTRRREDPENESREKKPNVEELSALVVDAAFCLHCDLGPGLLETVYEAVLAKLLHDRGLSVTRQEIVPIEFGGLRINEGFRADLVVENAL